MTLLMQHFLNRSARLFPDVVAIDTGLQQITYKNLQNRVEQLCYIFSQKGTLPGRHLVIFSSNSIDYVACYFACARLGLVFVPLNTYLQPSEMEWIINDCDPVAIVAEVELVPVINELSENVRSSRLHFVCAEKDKTDSGWLPLQVEHQDSNFENDYESMGDQLVVQMYTSGTTGRPKGVMLSHENITAIVLAWLHEMPMRARQSRLMQATPLFHVGGMVVCLCTIASGGTLLLLPKFDPQLALHTLHDKGVTHTLLVPSMIQQLLLLPDIEGLTFPALEVMAYGASIMPQAIMSRAMQTFDCDFLQGYGLTETCGVATALRAEDHKCSSGEETPRRLSSAGRELLCCQVRVVDENFQDTEIDEIGEIVVRGANVTKGYWNNEKATAETIINGWLKTGDLGRVDQDGYIYVVDRLKDMIDVSGENVYPAEVENVLAHHPEIAEVAVIGLPNLILGEEVAAVVVLKESDVYSREQQRSMGKSLKQYACEHLSAYKCPLRYKFVEALPRTPAGKVQKQVLKDWFK